MTGDGERDLTARSLDGQAPGGARQDRRDEATRRVTNGDGSGTDGLPADLIARVRRADRRDFLTGWAIVAAVAVVVTMVNSLSVQMDNPDVAGWEPWVWEATSAITILAVAWIPWLAITVAPPPVNEEGARPWFRSAMIHLPAMLIYSALHVAGFMVLRHAAYAALGVAPYDYEIDGPQFVYELRKDALSYAAFAATFWLTARLRRAREPVVRPVSFDIRDGARIIRAPVGDILAVSSAGNYVEFWLADGRRPLMRATLAAIEVELEPFGFVRAHRSWLVNGARVTGLTPDGSGDWTVELGTVEVPLSRRYPSALARLKG